MVTLNINEDELQDLQRDAACAARFFNHLQLAGQGNDRWGVAVNTIRAFRGFDQPLSQYNKWGDQHANAFLGGAYAGTPFPNLHHELRQNLDRYWQPQNALRVSHAYKLVDLFILRMAYLDGLDPRMRVLLVNEGHPPLDRYTLDGLARLVPGLVIGSPSMGAIECESQYASLQSVIRQITQHAQIPNLNFDIWCWPIERRAMLIPN